MSPIFQKYKLQLEVTKLVKYQNIPNLCLCPQYEKTSKMHTKKHNIINWILLLFIYKIFSHPNFFKETEKLLFHQFIIYLYLQVKVGLPF